MALALLFLSGCGPRDRLGEEPSEGYERPPAPESIRNLFGCVEPWEVFFAELQAAAAARDPVRLAALMHYPLRAHGLPPNDRVEGPEAFVARFEELFPECLTSLVVEQSFADLFVRDQGAMIGSGEIWFTSPPRGCEEALEVDPCELPIKVVTINLEWALQNAAAKATGEDAP